MTVQPINPQHGHDQLTRRTLATAAALLDAAARGDRPAMRSLLRELAAKPGVTPDVEALLVEVSAEFRLTVDQVLSSDRGRGIREAVDARHVLCYAAGQLGMSWSHVGRQLDRDHSTVMYGSRRVTKDARLRAAADRVIGRIGWGSERRPAPLDAVSA